MVASASKLLHCGQQSVEKLRPIPGNTGWLCFCSIRIVQPATSTCDHRNYQESSLRPCSVLPMFSQAALSHSACGDRAIPVGRRARCMARDMRSCMPIMIVTSEECQVKRGGGLMVVQCKYLQWDPQFDDWRTARSTCAPKGPPAKSSSPAAAMSPAYTLTDSTRRRRIGLPITWRSR